MKHRTQLNQLVIPAFGIQYKRKPFNQIGPSLILNNSNFISEEELIAQLENLSEEEIALLFMLSKAAENNIEFGKVKRSIYPNINFPTIDILDKPTFI